ncbi:MAG: hypothetical protein D6685_13995 [Bacteroidetes bacterium]|nr:hypothetical protein AWN76_004575 [Rhodothermaceae bacterium RA]RMH55359.1 MAG: hypothetical protein D6685_13995 [Bacteroidota bacterium]
MNALRYSLAVVLVGLLGVGPSAAQQFNNVGQSAANFLKIPVGPRASALGGAYTAVVNDATATYWNVAGMMGVPNHEVTLTTNMWLLDLRHDFVSGVFSVGVNNRIGLSISYLNYGDDLIETTPEQPRGTGLTFSAYDVAIGLGYARQLTDRFAVGGQAKYVRESIYKSSASGMAFDLGLLYTSDWNNLRIGAAISNFGPDLQMTGDNLRFQSDPYPETGQNPDDVPVFLETEPFSLPIQFQVGASITPYRGEAAAVTAMLDVRDSRDFNQEVRLGGEVAIFNTLFLRGGGNLLMIEGSPFGGGDDVVVEGNPDADNTSIGNAYRNPTTITRGDLRDGQPLFNLGAGLQFFLPNSRTGFKFDYAFSRIKTLDDVHRFGVSLLL